VAPGGRRLGSFLTGLLDVLTVLDATPAPRGNERDAAEALRSWCADRWPRVDWQVQRYGPGGANLIGRHRPSGRVDVGQYDGVLLYSHLDTSLDGGPGDSVVTGRSDPVGSLLIDDDKSFLVSGFGLGVARAPAAAALLGFAELADPAAGSTLLLAGSGTHRLGDAPTGVTAYLEAFPRPSAAVIAKAGPAGVLWSEPGAAYLQVRLSGRQGAVLARDRALPSGGVIVHAGAVIAELESWRREYLAGREDSTGQIGPEIGIGAIRAGRWDKPDLLPATLELGLYLVTMPGEDVPALARALEARLVSALTHAPEGAPPAAAAPAGCVIEVAAQVVHPAASTRPDAPIVRRALAAWTETFGPPVEIRNWSGSTDGVVLRGRGIDTVRLGPQLAASELDARRDQVALTVLNQWPAIYATLLT
jgi:acetylornithine deacetylase/succinyl-diaminopimelate desuccinylase-like protein